MHQHSDLVFHKFLTSSFIPSTPYSTQHHDQWDYESHLIIIITWLSSFSLQLKSLYSFFPLNYFCSNLISIEKAKNINKFIEKFNYVNNYSSYQMVQFIIPIKKNLSNTNANAILIFSIQCDTWSKKTLNQSIKKRTRWKAATIFSMLKCSRYAYIQGTNKIKTYFILLQKLLNS